MREIIVGDLFILTKILGKLKLKIETTKEVDGKIIIKSRDQLGAEMITIIMENFYKVEDDICEMFAGIFEKKKEEIKRIKLKELMGYFEEFKKMEGIEDFLSLAAKYTK